MENDNTTDPKYVARFNDGYVLARYMPDLSEQLSKSKSKSPAFLAMQDGRNQYISEQFREKLPSWLRKDSSAQRPRSFARDKGKSKDPEK